jgi:hypothetical protein
MKNRLKGVMACGVALMIVAGMVSFADAGGVINWKIKVNNTSGHNVKVALVYGANNSYQKEQVINNGESYTFETGNKCASFLGGRVYDVGVNMAERCAGAGQPPNCVVACYDTAWKIAKEDDGAYHFQKD